MPPRPSQTALPEFDVTGLCKALRLFDRRTIERGMAYARAGAVRRLDLDRAGRGFAADVQGTEVYRCEWLGSSRRWRSDCSCPVGEECKHAYAAACVMLAGIVQGAVHQRKGSVLAAPPRLESLRLPPLRVADLQFGDIETWDDDFDDLEDALEDFDDELAETALARLRPPRPAALPSRIHLGPPPAQDLSTLFEMLAAAKPGSHLAHDLCQDIAGLSGVSPVRVNVAEVAAESDGVVRCSILALEIHRLATGPLPPAVMDRLKSSEARAKMRRRAEQHLHEQLERWASPSESTFAKHVRLVIRPTPGQNGLLGFELVPLLSSARLKDEPRSPEQLRALLNQTGGSGQLSPASRALTDWLCTHYFSASWWMRDQARGSDLERLALALGHTGLITWETGQCAEQAAVAGIFDSAPLTLGYGSAAIEPFCTVEDGAPELQLRVRLGDERLLRLEEVVLLPSTGFADVSYLLAAGALWRVRQEPPSAVMQGFRVLGTVRLDGPSAAPLLRRLARNSPTLARTLEMHTLRVPCRPVFLLDGDEDGLSLRLLAVATGSNWPAESLSSDGFEYEADGTWQRLGETPNLAPGSWHALDSGSQPAIAVDAPADAVTVVASEREAWLSEPDLEAVAPAAQWLTSLNASCTEDGWCIPLRPPHFQALVSAWERRPAGAAYFATRRIKRLLGDGLRPLPSLDIRSSGKDWFEVKLSWQVEGKTLTFADVEALAAASSGFVRLGDGWVRASVREQLRETIETLADAGIDASEQEQRLGLWQLASTPPHVLERLEDLGADAATVAAARRLRRKVDAFRGLARVGVPRTFAGELRAYQRDGLDFLAFAADLGTGAVLADDMGLGKTVQTLAWLERLRLAGRLEAGPALVLCPASVVHNWKEEAARFAPKMRTIVLASGQERHGQRDHGSADLFITNYTLLRLDAEKWGEKELGALILDEAQNVKNPDAAVAKAVRGLRARYRLALTGTPLENRTRDVWSIVECVSPGYLGTRKRFEQRFDGDVFDSAAQRLLSSRLRPLMLRRRKSEVAPDLPSRIEEVRRCELTSEQRRLYLTTLRASRRLVDGLSRKGAEGERARIQVLAALTRLRQICCHPALVDAKLARSGSAKFELLMEVLEPLLEEGHKVLVFSQFAQCIALLARELTKREVRHFVLTGATQKRERVVSEFQASAEPGVFLISLKAGGTGLNLTAASYVVLFDPWWNPAVEAQAIDRTHRIGQTRSVMAYRIVATDTIEEKILELQREKASLADAVVDDASFGRRLGKDDLAFLLEG